jgi:hypothetical protein
MKKISHEITFEARGHEYTLKYLRISRVLGLYFPPFLEFVLFMPFFLGHNVFV